MNRKNVLRGLALVSTFCGLVGGWFLGQTNGVPEEITSDGRIEGPNVGITDERADADEVRLNKPIRAKPKGPLTGRNDVPTNVPLVQGTVAQDPPAPMEIRKAANTFRHGQNNAFFDEAAYARSFAANGGAGIDQLRKELQNTEALRALPEGVDFFQDAPEAVLDRMAMIDMLGVIAKDENKALDALVEIATQPLDASLPPQVIRALVGEKYDAFVELARHDWKVASSAFSALNNDKLQEAMRAALVSGLVDSGTPNEEALRMVQAI